MAAKVTFDVANKIIQIDVVPTLDAGEYVVDIDVKVDLYSDGKEDWITGPPFTPFDFPIRNVGGDPLPGSKTLGATFFLRSDWKIRPYEASHSFRVNGNLFSEDGTSPFTPTVGTYNVLLTSTVSSLVDSIVQQLTEIQLASYQDAVWIDALSGTTGTEYPSGTRADPVNNLTDAQTIAVTLGFVDLNFAGDYSFILTDVLDGYNVAGENTTRSVLTLASGVSTNDTGFRDATLGGYFDGSVDIYDCHMTTVSGITGNIHTTLFEESIFVGRDGGEDLRILSCTSGIAGSAAPILDLGGVGCPPVIIRDYQGGLELRGKGDAHSTSIDLSSGQLKIDLTTVLAGAVIVRGVGKVVDAADDTLMVSAVYGGVTLVNETMNPESITNQNWAYNIDGEIPGTTGDIMRHLAFGNHVVVDVNNGTSGTAFPLGLHAHPVDNVADALVIAVANDLDRIDVMEDVVIAGTDDISGFHIYGNNPGKSEITLASGVTTALTSFYNCSLTGTLDGAVTVRDSVLGDLYNMQGSFFDCMLDPADHVLNGAQTSHFIDCNSGVPGAGTPEIDMGGSGRALAMRGYKGGIKIVNKTGSESVSLDFVSGQAILDNTITAGHFVVRGTAKMTDNSTGTATVDITNLVNPYTVADQVYEEDHTEHTTIDSYGYILGKTVGTCLTGILTTTNFTTNRTEPNGFWTDKLFVQFTGNVTAALAGKTSKLSAYVAASGQFTVEDALPIAPANGDTFYLINE